jgi:hypothetical protein
MTLKTMFTFLSKFKTPFILGLFLFFAAASAQGQTYDCQVSCATLPVTDDCFFLATVEKGCRCFDGVDNDGDGKIDSNDTNCASYYGLSFVGVGSGCSINPLSGSAFDGVGNPTVSGQNTSDTQSKVAVGDVDFDGVPDAIVTSKWASTIRVIATTNGQADGSQAGDYKAVYN